MKKALAILCLLIWGTIVSQNDEAYVQNLTDTFTEKLKDRGITNYFSAKQYCMGNIQMFKLSDGTRCMSKGTYVETYVFWTEGDGAAWVKKIDNCGMFLSVQLNNDEIMSYVLENAGTLESGVVKRFETENMKRGVPESRTKIHNCLREYAFSMNGKDFGQEFNVMAFLESSSDEPGDQNLNFEYNSKLPIASLTTDCEALIIALESEAQFKRM